jgi:murein DD-endopeptidase MepM/ murein hydrolase activator NlpD
VKGGAVVLVVPWTAVVAVVSLFVGPVAGWQVPACLVPPVDAVVVDAFRDPGCEWCPGNRGVTYGSAAGSVVRAAAAGTVSFSGVVAGTRYVVVEHAAGGLRATYGGLASTSLGAGDAVVAGAIVGVAAGDLHFGLRRGETYVDPTPLLGRLVERARLVPTDGTPPRPAPPTRLECAGGPTTKGGRLPLTGLAPDVWREPHHDYPALDVLVPPGTVVRAWRAGTVRNVHDNPRNCAGAAACREPCGIGLTVVDATSPGVTWTYCHLSALDVGPGDRLVAGARVGRSGNTGRSGAPHLHVEIRVAGRQVCPQRALAAVAAGDRVPDPRRLPTSGCSF